MSRIPPTPVPPGPWHHKPTPLSGGFPHPTQRTIYSGTAAVARADNAVIADLIVAAVNAREGADTNYSVDHYPVSLRAAPGEA